METVRYHAAGGIVVRGGQALLLYKKSKGETMLPKGHVEAGETLEAAALRETREETGYLHLRLLAHLGTAPARFRRQRQEIIREETYFLMELLDDARDESQIHADAQYDRAVFELRWTPVTSAPEQLTFEPAKTFARRAAEWLSRREGERDPHHRYR
jgi:8-oxo-dGTP pyrophosphatase MutT (NUDIX family)